MRASIQMTLMGLLAAATTVCAADEPRKPAAPPQGKEMRYIYKDGEPQGRVFVPASVQGPVLLAQEELRNHLEAITGKRMDLAWRRAKPDEAGIVLAVRSDDDWRGKESAQSFVIEEDAAARQVRITGNTGIAVLYGVYQYLGDLGVRWLTPGAIGTNVPRMADIAIRPGKRSCSPSFLSRTLALSSTLDNHFGGVPDPDRARVEYTLYLIRNRTQTGRNISTKDFTFGLCLTGSSHSVKPMTGLTTDKVKAGLMEKEPERFALVTGPDFIQKRRYDDGQVCFTNEKNIQTAIDNCVAFFKDMEKTRGERNSDLDEDATVSMGLSDCNGTCECPQCTKVAGQEPCSKDRLVWSFWNRVAKGLNERMPGRMIAVHAPYMELTQPPADVRIEPNVMVTTPLVHCWDRAPENKASYPFPKAFLQAAMRMREAGATLGCYNYLNFPWSPTPLLILDAAEGYAKLGYKHYHLEAMQRTEYTWPIIWSLAQFTWDSSRPPREYLKQFCAEYYGPRGGEDVLWFLDEMTRNAFTLERINFGGSFDTSYMLPDSLIKDARARLNAAVRQAQGQSQERLRRFRDAIESQFQLAETYRAYCKALNNRTPEDIAAFLKRARALEDFWQRANLNLLNTMGRSPLEAARLFEKTDFEKMKPVARKELQGKGPGDERWMKELFAGAQVPKNVPNLWPLPEVWKFHHDFDNRYDDPECLKPEYDDSKGWPSVSTWSFPSSQGYNIQVGGHFWYRVRFTPPAFPAGKKVFLRIGSLDDSGDVYLNGVKVGSQPNPNDWDKSFVMDVTAALKPGVENVLAVHGYNCGGGEGVWRPSALYTD